MQAVLNEVRSTHFLKWCVVHIGEDRHNTYFEVVELADNTTARINTTYNREKAKLFTKDGAIKVRDRLNKNREGKTNVWSITKYEV